MPQTAQNAAGLAPALHSRIDRVSAADCYVAERVGFALHLTRLRWRLLLPVMFDADAF